MIFSLTKSDQFARKKQKKRGSDKEPLYVVV